MSGRTRVGSKDDFSELSYIELPVDGDFRAGGRHHIPVGVLVRQGGGGGRGNGGGRGRQEETLDTWKETGKNIMTCKETWETWKETWWKTFKEI